MSKNLPTAQKHTTFIEWVKSEERNFLFPSWIDDIARKRMIACNTSYILNCDFKQAWETPEGYDSIQKAIIDAFFYAATMPETGSIIPFKNTVEFCPAVECFESALLTGKKAPCKSIKIECIYKNDMLDIESKNDVYNYSLKPKLPREEIVGVIVQAIFKDGTSKGNLFDVKELLRKAAEHSASYKYYLNDMAALAKAQSEGKDYIIKWEKKVYAKDISSPYEGADREKMFIKLAGKSFLKPIFKQHMINCVIDENENDSKDAPTTPLQIVNRSIDNIKEDIAQTQKQINAPNVQDAEIVENIEPVKQKAPAQKTMSKRSELFAD